MRSRFGMLISLLFATSISFGAAYDPLLGTWELDLQTQGQTKYSPGYPVPKSQTYKFESAADNGVKFVNDTVGADGKPMHSEYTAKLDGKDYPVKGDPNRETVALKRTRTNWTEGTSKKAGQVTGTFSIMIWGNGLLMTITSKEIRNGQTYDNIEVYHKVVQ